MLEKILICPVYFTFLALALNLLKGFFERALILQPAFAKASASRRVFTTEPAEVSG